MSNYVVSLPYTTVSPEITCENYQYYAKKGDAVTLTCTVVAHPEPSFTWEGGKGVMGATDQETESKKVEILGVLVQYLFRSLIII